MPMWLRRFYIVQLQEFYDHRKAEMEAAKASANQTNSTKKLK